MTAAQILTAAQLIKTRDMSADAIVSFTEMGSEGALLIIGTWRNRGPRCMIARDGTPSWDETDEREAQP